MKWLVVGRWREERIPIWSLGYFRFWLVKRMTQANPMVMFIGSPLYIVYLRLLGAKIGRNVVIFSRTVPVCPDLLSIGDGTIIKKNAICLGYRARAGFIETGTVTIGRDAFIGEATVLDIGTSIGDGASWGTHRRCTGARPSPPASGITAPRAGDDRQLTTAGPRPCAAAPAGGCSSAGSSRSTASFWSSRSLWSGCSVSAVLPGHRDLQLGALAFFVDTAAVTLLLFIGLLIGGLIFILTVPRLLNLFLKPDKVYPLYGLHYSLQRTISRGSPTPASTSMLFGDSSYIVYYLKALGYDLNKVVQTGSNFGPAVGHESPFLSSVGSGTMASDGLNMMNADFTSTSFRLSRVSVAGRHFLGTTSSFRSMPGWGRTACWGPR